MIQVEIKRHPFHPETHRLVKVIHHGRVYATSWAEPFPTEAEVRQAWRSARRQFRPYDESTGRYCD